jgi:D-alanyl-D-alanine carboxypeptidase (penicillin-binding protein 5/6)
MKKRIKKFLILIIIFVVSIGTTANIYSISFVPEFEISAEAAVLIDMDTGKTIYTKNADLKEMPSQLATVMTALVVLDKCDDIKTTRINTDNSLFRDYRNYEFQSDLRYAAIDQGDNFTVEEYLYAMLIHNSCEAAVVLANDFGDDSVLKFVGMMNDKATQLGALNTHFTDPYGLYDSEQVTTANDMSKIILHAVRIPTLYTICTANEFKASSKQVTWRHTNLMAWKASDKYSGVKGIKTGGLINYGRNLATMVDITRDSRLYRYLYISLKSPYREDDVGNTVYTHLDDAKRIFNWAKEHIYYKVVLENNEELSELSVKYAKGDGTVLVKPADNFQMLWDDNIDPNAIERIITTEKNLYAPIEKGQKLGTLELSFSGETLTVIDLVATTDVERSDYKVNAEAAKRFNESGWFKAAIWISVLLCALYLGLCIYAYMNVGRRRRRRRRG